MVTIEQPVLGQDCWLKLDQVGYGIAEHRAEPDDKT
jgi:hypothetical protein